MLLSFTLVAAAGLLASAKPVLPSRRNSTATRSTRLLISGSGYILNGGFSGSALSVYGGVTKEGVAPSWLIPTNNGFIANDENSATVYTLGFDQVSNSLTQGGEYNGSTGVVHFEYNKEKTRMLGAGYGSQRIDVWDTSAQDGTLKLIKTISTNQTASRPHQAVLDPSGAFFVVNDLGLDSLFILGAADDGDIHIASTVSLPKGCGPRHGAFYAPEGVPTRYFLACENSHEIHVFRIGAGKVPSFQPLQAVQTSVNANDSKAASLTAAELLLFTNSDMSADIYVSNRLVGDATDTIAHFRLPAPSTGCSEPGNLTALTADRLVSSGGVGPRGMNLAADGSFLFVGNQQAGPAGLAVLPRNASSGALDKVPVATVDFDLFANGKGWGFGPQFVLPLDATASGQAAVDIQT